MAVTDIDFELFVDAVYRLGVEQAANNFGASGRYLTEEVDELVAEYRRRADNAQNGYPPKIIAVPQREPWYAGPCPDDRYWPALRQNIETAGRIPPDQIDNLDSSTTKIIAYTRKPVAGNWKSKGLILGHVQSGKTTNFTAVIAKAVDIGYNLVVVLSGIHNGLRTQTQQRLEDDLCELHRDGWITLTGTDRDFRTPPYTLESVLPNVADRKAVLLVVKKNATVLRKLLRWLEASSQNGGMRNVKALVVDDEADQATVATARINPLIRGILGALPRHTFVGYTATPFANVLIDPSDDDDLYPRDFILSLPPPARYFGTEMIFGRDDPDDDDAAVDGHDMVRIIPDGEAALLRPPRNTPFEPDLTPTLEEAILWFWIATAARRARGDVDHSTMLVHTSMKTAVHAAFRDPIELFRREVLALLDQDEPGFETRLRDLWDRETTRVPTADFPGLNLTTPAFETVRGELRDVVVDTKIVLDNSRSPERLDYRSGPVTAIAIGGNTLSRGLTLEGLVVSFFIRAASAYDTLLQMGRWFGFRIGYEDLPRIYMTSDLRNWFRHLAMVEHEIRLDISRYEQQDLTPLDFGPRIRTHPTLLATQKLGAARQAFTSYGGRRVQTRYFRHRDPDWLNGNLIAASTLVSAIDSARCPAEDRGDGVVLWRDVPVHLVRGFIDDYTPHDDSPDLDSRLLLSYIDKEVTDDSLMRWSVAVMSARDGSNGHVQLGDRTFGRIVRARLADGEADRADIKTLMSKEHRVIDLDISQRDARRHPEEQLMLMRNADLVHRDRGLLLLYPIDPASQPEAAHRNSREALDAAADVIGMALVFPGNARQSVRNSFIQVDLSTLPLEDDDETDDLIENDPDDED